MVQRKSILAFLLALLMVLTLLTACGDSGSTPTTTPPPATPDKTEAPAAGDDDEGGEETAGVTYPLTEGHTFTCWWPFENDLATKMKTLADNEYFKYVFDLTGVTIDFVHPAQGGERENYNLMLVSGVFEDFIRDVGTYHLNGLDDAVETEVIHDLRNYIEYLPNYERVRNEIPDRAKQSMTDKGYLAGLAMLIEQPQTFVNGMFVRKDWLDKLDLEVPETISEFEDMLIKIRDNFPSTANGPMWMNNTGNAGMAESFGVTSPSRSPVMYRDGKLEATILLDDYKEYIVTMADWFDKGLLWKDFLSDSGIIPFFNSQAKVANGEFGVIYDCFVYLDIYNSIGVDEDFLLIPIPNPVKNHGDMLHTGMYTSWARQAALGITTQCDDVPLACKFWDYGYSEEGALRGNYGIEGLTYELDENGQPWYTEFATKNPDGHTFYHIQNMYMIQNAPFFRVGARELYGMSESERACEPAWTSNKDSAYSLPPVTLTAEEGNLRSNILGDINTLIDENLVRFISGAKPMSDYDAFIDQIKEMGVEEIIPLYEAAIERYENRGK